MVLKRLVFVVLALGLLAAAASAATVDALLRGLETKAADPASGGLAFDRMIATETDARTGDLRIGVILWLDGGLPDLSGIDGLVVGSVHGTIATARLPLRELDRLASVPGIAHIAASRLLQPTLDEAIPAANIDDVWNGAPAYTGAGVLIGVIDSGIDYTHDDFRHTDGTTRILSLWDVFGTGGNPPQGYTSGVEYTSTQINAALSGGTAVPEADVVGHGTHVSGIATGNGRASSGQYKGVAFESDILFVKPYASGFPEDATIDAMNYLAQKAQALGQPIAINMSLGGHIGAHDGTSPQEQLIDSLSGAGVVFCVAAGNEGEDHIADYGPASSYSFLLRVPDYTPTNGPDNDTWLVTVWYDGTTSISVTLGFGGNTTDPVASGDVELDLSTDAGYVVIDNASQGVDPGSGAKVCYIQVSDHAGYTPGTGDWTISISGGSGTAHAWVAYSTMPAGFPASDQSYSIGMPATAQEAIAVAAFKTRNSWPVVGGTAGYGSGNTWGDAPIGALAPFSSRGPTRDGREKPDIAAPGMAIVSCYSHLQSPPASNLELIPGGKYFATQGTSMATPLTCGVVGLMLEKNPQLTAADVRSILRSTASHDGYTGQVWTNTFGAGKVDAAAALAAVPAAVVATGDIDGDGSTTVLDVVLLVDYIVDPAGHPLDADQRDMADVYPAGGGDGTLNIQDVVRIVDFILGDATPGAPAPVAAPARFMVGAPVLAQGEWTVPVTISGEQIAGGQFALTLDGVQWQAQDVMVTGSDGHAIAQTVGDQVRVLVYSPSNHLPAGGVTVNVPFTSASEPTAAPRISGLLVAGPHGYAREVQSSTGFGVLPALHFVQVAPNPAVNQTNVQFQLGRTEPVKVGIYDLKGRRIRDLDLGQLGEGMHAATWDGRDENGLGVASGVYLVRVVTPQQTVTRKVVLSRK